jgi:hypothetical protein
MRLARSLAFGPARDACAHPRGWVASIHQDVERASEPVEKPLGHILSKTQNELTWVSMPC